MRRFAILLLVALTFAAFARTASAGVLVHIEKSSQRMMVALNGRLAYVWPVSTGRGGFGTPVGRFRAQWLARRWFSTRYYGSPMPYSFFFHRGYAIHGTTYTSRLGGSSSSGFLRLHPGHPSTM